MSQSWGEAKHLNLILPGNFLHLQKDQALFHDYSFLFLKAHLLTFCKCVYAQSIQTHSDFCKREGLVVSPCRECCISLARKSSTVQATEEFSVAATEAANQPSREPRAPNATPGWDTALGSAQLSCPAQVQSFTPIPAHKGKVNVKCEHRAEEGSFDKAPWDWILRGYFKFFQRSKA